MRQFKTGATRDADDTKPDYAGYLSALVIKRFGQYMLKHQTQKDGTKRGSNNWKMGIPKEAYVSSLARHHEDVQLYFEGFEKEMTETLEDSLCAIIFNAQGLLYEILKERIKDIENQLFREMQEAMQRAKIELGQQDTHNNEDELTYWGC